jgi:hypothetical protein
MITYLFLSSESEYLGYPNILNRNQYEVSSPLDQFEIRDLLSLNAPILGNLNISLTNIGLYLVIGFFLAFNLTLLATNYNRLVSNN